jgi:hypothetical protein
MTFLGDEEEFSEEERQHMEAYLGAGKGEEKIQVQIRPKLIKKCYVCGEPTHYMDAGAMLVLHTTKERFPLCKRCIYIMNRLKKKTWM